MAFRSPAHSQTPRKPGVAPPLKWTDAHMYAIAEGPASALAYSVTFGKHLPPSCPQFPHLYEALNICSFFMSSEHLWSREKEKHRVHDWAGQGKAGWANDPKGGLKSDCQRHHFYFILHSYSVLWPHSHHLLYPIRERITLK